MNQPRFISLLSATVITFFLASCGGNEEKSATDTMSSDSSSAMTTTPDATAPGASAIVTTPQGMMIVRHKVSNFAKWKVSYDDHDSMRLASGIHSYVIGRGTEDTNMVLVAVKVDDMAKAKTFAKDPGLKQAMQKGGVVGSPTFMFTTMVFQDTVKISSNTRSLSTFTVKDWDAWQKAFDSNKQLRIDNGIQERAYGYDADDNHKVTLVVAVNDTAKARAFRNSDVIKQKRAEAGVVSTPQMFSFQVVQRY